MKGAAALTLLRGASRYNNYPQAVNSTYLAATGAPRQHYSVLALYGVSIGYTSMIARGPEPTTQANVSPYFARVTFRLTFESRPARPCPTSMVLMRMICHLLKTLSGRKSEARTRTRTHVNVNAFGHPDSFPSSAMLAWLRLVRLRRRGWCSWCTTTSIS